MTADHVNVFILYGTETNTTVNAALLLASHVVTWHICHPVAEPSASPEMSATHFRSKNVAPESSRPNCKVLVSELDGFDIWDHWNRINVQNSEGRTHDPYTVYFLLCSTTGQGEAPRTMLNFWKRALRKNVESLKGLPFAVFGLGDSSYEKFNVMAKMLQNRLVQLGANPLVQRGLGDDQDASGYLQTFLPWITELQSVVTGHDTVKTSHTLETVFGGDDHLTNLFEVSIVTVGASGDPAEDVPTPHNSKSQTPASRDDMKRIKYETEGQCYLALRLVERTCLTWSGADEEESPLHRSRDHRDVYHIGFEPIVDPFQCDRTVVPSPLCVEGSDLTWLCGDLLGFLPPNHTDVVEGLLKYFQLDPEKHRVRISMNPQYPIQWQTSGSGQEVFRAGQDVCSPWLTSQNGDGYVIRPDILFRDYLDIEAPATPLLLRDLARYATDPDEQEKLLELSRVDNNSEFYQYVTRERRHPLEVLQDFPSIRGVPLKVLIAHIPWGGITPRWYSLSSASFWTGEGSLSSTEPQRPCFALTVAHVQYQTPYGRKRVGLCSDYLCKRAALGDVVHAVLRQNPKITFDATKDRKTPVVFFSTGTGIAPARSMIQARSTIAQQENSYPTHPDILFFGVRSKHGALLYEFEWANKYDARVLDANFAFSRDTPGARVYVQHALRSNDVLARNVAELLTEQNANVFISGGSKNMPRDVMRALAAVLHDVKPEMFPELNGAESYIQTMKRNGRLCVDAW